MTDTSLSDRLEAMKGDYQTKHEALNAKLHQAKAIAKVAVHGNPSESDIFHVLWGVLDLLELACKECEGLTPKDLGQDA
jgi:hypothetical protein